MPSLDSIKRPIAKELALFEKDFRASVKSDTFLLNKIIDYMVKKKGKQMRPMFVFFSAKLFGDIKAATYTAGTLVELMHTATLVHDDVVDNAYERRGVFSINALWKNKIAVLVGDYLLARGLLHSVNNNQFELLKIVADAVREMSEGELLQIEKARRMDISEALYFDIIRKKTASLIAACCASGAASAGASEKDIDQMRLFGEKVGIAFQIKDDTFDFSTDNAGKPKGLDLKEKKITLPLIYALQNAAPKESKRIIKLIKQQRNEADFLIETVNFVQANGGLERAYNKMQQYRAEALEILHRFEDSDARQGLEQLIDFTIERKN